MKITCDMAIDLMPLYKDGLASEDSKEAIKEHLRECPSCRKAYNEYNADQTPYEEVKCGIKQDDLSKKYKKIADQLHRQHTIYSAAVISAVVLSLGLSLLSKIKYDQKIKK